MSKFEGKRALVTGAAGGIGRAIVAGLKDNGAVVAGCDRVGTETAADIALDGDLTDAEFVDHLIGNAKEALGGLDILVNNAGLMRRGSITETSDDDLRMSLAVNVEAPFRLCRSAIPVMAAEGGGAIVNVASCWGKYPGPDHAVYCMTKAALASLTQCAGRDHAHQGIRINAVCPNEVDTPMLRTGFERRGLDSASAIRDLDRSVPLGRIAQPEDIADVVCFLASRKARYICGALVEVNGGKPVY